MSPRAYIYIYIYIYIYVCIYSGSLYCLFVLVIIILISLSALRPSFSLLFRFTIDRLFKLWIDYKIKDACKPSTLVHFNIDL